METVYYEFAMLLLASAVVGALAVYLRQPLIVAFIVVGILVGPSVLGWVTAQDQVDLLAQIGVTILLFVVGLRLDLHLVRNLGAVALATGLGQLAFTIVIGYFIALALGMGHVTALYVAVALTFSSTIIIVKLLSDKREVDSLHGRIAVGFLIVQDIAVVFAMMLLGVPAGAGDAAGWAAELGRIALTVTLIGVGIAALMRYVLPRILDVLARSQELLLVFAVAWGTSLATAGEVMGFSKEVGAFLAGFSLASTSYREAIASRLVSLRDFLLLFFFIDLGARLDLATVGQDLPAAVVLSLFVLVGNPLIVMAIMGYMGYRKRTGFLAGLTVAQISEFSIIFIALGISIGHIDRSTLGLVTMIGLATIAISSYMIIYSHQLYAFCERWLDLFERRRPHRELLFERGQAQFARVDVLVFGTGRYGRRILEQLAQRGLAVLGIDFDPEAVRRHRRHGLPVVFGDAEDPHFSQSLPLDRARWVVSTLPELAVNLMLLKILREHRYQGSIAMTAHDEEDAKALAKAGATRVLAPFSDAADQGARLIAEAIATAGR
jgi:Kef-type K+ transport system membrane component KefB